MIRVNRSVAKFIKIYKNKDGTTKIDNFADQQMKKIVDEFRVYRKKSKKGKRISKVSNKNIPIDQNNPINSNIPINNNNIQINNNIPINHNIPFNNNIVIYNNIPINNMPINTIPTNRNIPTNYNIVMENNYN